MYDGTRDAGTIWESCYSQPLTSMGFVQGRACPCCFHHPTLNVTVVVHGDIDAELQVYEDCLKEYFEFQLKMRLGSEDCDLKETRLLNRIMKIDR